MITMIIINNTNINHFETKTDDFTHTGKMGGNKNRTRSASQAADAAAPAPTGDPHPKRANSGVSDLARDAAGLGVEDDVEENQHPAPPAQHHQPVQPVQPAQPALSHGIAAMDADEVLEPLLEDFSEDEVEPNPAPQVAVAPPPPHFTAPIEISIAHMKGKAPKPYFDKAYIQQMADRALAIVRQAPGLKDITTTSSNMRYAFSAPNMDKAATLRTFLSDFDNKFHFTSFNSEDSSYPRCTIFCEDSRKKRIFRELVIFVPFSEQCNGGKDASDISAEMVSEGPTKDHLIYNNEGGIINLGAVKPGKGGYNAILFIPYSEDPQELSRMLSAKANGRTITDRSLVCTRCHRRGHLATMLLMCNTISDYENRLREAQLKAEAEYREKERLRRIAEAEAQEEEERRKKEKAEKDAEAQASIARTMAQRYPRGQGPD